MIQKTYFKTKDYCKVKFSFAPENAETVEVLGLNSDWENSIVLKKNKKDGTFSTEISLPKDSQHQFKYLVNKTEWLNDAEADSTAPNEFGGINSVITL
jgi:1,4-alpha-glucan branching enzyme